MLSAHGGYNVPGDDPFHLRRVHGDRQFSRLVNWLSFDPGKHAARPALAAEAGIAASEAPPARRPLKTLFVLTEIPVGGARGAARQPA